MPLFNEDLFRQNFRISRDIFDWLLKQIGKALEKEELRMQTTICSAKRLVIGLYTLATTAEYRTIANLFGVSRSSVCVIFNEVIEAIVLRLKEQFIKLPVGKEMREVIDGFLSTWVGFVTRYNTEFLFLHYILGFPSMCGCDRWNTFFNSGTNRKCRRLLQSESLS